MVTNVKKEEKTSSASTVPAPESSTVKPKEEKVEVEKNVLEQILEKQEKQADEIQRLTKDNKKLTAVADKSRLAWYDQMHSEGGLIHTFRVGIYTDYDDLDKDDLAKKKIVLGWKMIKDEVRFENNVLKENQIFRLYLDEGEGKEPKQKDIDIYQFTRELERITGELISEAKGPKGITKTLKFSDGRVIEFDIRFLNP